MGSLDTTKIFEDMEEKGRRLPVYLVLDVSGSMSGEPIEAVAQGVNEMIAGLRGLPARQQDTIHIKVIRFSDSVEATQLTPLYSFTPPPLRAGGTTHLGDALRVLDQATTYSGDLRKNSMDTLGDWKPMVFLLTDGDPTDNYKDAAATILKRTREHSTAYAPQLNVWAIGCGPSVMGSTLKEVSDNALLMKDMTRSHLVELFAWLTATMSRVTRKITVPGGASEETTVELPEQPPFVARL